ncbi:MAG: response regulator [Rhodothalassiaceae bacterium]
MARILLAEDDEAVRSFVRRALESAGHEIVEVTDGGQALERLAAERFDLLLSDIVMPVMDGIALALKVTVERPDLPILLMTGFAAEKQRAHNLEALTTEVLSKPFTMDQLLRTVRRALEKGSPAG